MRRQQAVFDQQRIRRIRFFRRDDDLLVFCEEGVAAQASVTSSVLRPM